MKIYSQNKTYELYTDIYPLMCDEEVVKRAKDEDDIALEYLLTKYKYFVRIKSKSYFLIGADREDVIQEGMIGLYKAIRDYDISKLSSFKAFAELCITRQIISAIKASTRQKHIPLNSYISLSKPLYNESSDRTLMDKIPSSKTQDPQEIIVLREELSIIEEKISSVLSSLELEVLLFYLEGKTYEQIADILEKHVKSIDNAIQRIKKKLEKDLPV